ncbi:hypothetical protein DB346_19940 [Verrucomicrobia bacterium LW23]|nr:hypothetical protein DB346_19940 [Verrucomicrobia bacterium LW23]
MPQYPGAPRCFSCNSELPREALNTAEPVPCSHCTQPLQSYIFPAQFRVDSVTASEAAVADDSTCFYHPDKRAAVCCDQCGRFICSLCDLEFEGRHVCPACMNNATEKAVKSTLKNESFNCDWFALLLGAFGQCFCILTGPATCVLVVLYWNAMSPYTSPAWYRTRMIIAMILGILTTLYSIGNLGYTLAELGRKPLP